MFYFVLWNFLSNLYMYLVVFGDIMWKSKEISTISCDSVPLNPSLNNLKMLDDPFFDNEINDLYCALKQNQQSY